MARVLIVDLHVIGPCGHGDLGVTGRVLEVHVAADGDAAELPELVRAIQRRAASVTVRRATLNDVFLQLTAGEHTPVAVGG